MHVLYRTRQIFRASSSIARPLEVTEGDFSSPSPPSPSNELSWRRNKGNPDTGRLHGEKTRRNETRRARYTRCKTSRRPGERATWRCRLARAKIALYPDGGSARMFDFACEMVGRRKSEPRNNGVNGMCTRMYTGARCCDASPDGWMDGDAAGNYVARTERPRNRNSPVVSPTVCLPPLPAIHPPLSLRGIRVSRCPPSCPLADVGQPPVSPPYPASARSPSPLVHASGRPTITVPRERRRETDTLERLRSFSQFPSPLVHICPRISKCFYY